MRKMVHHQNFNLKKWMFGVTFIPLLAVILTKKKEKRG